MGGGENVRARDAAANEFGAQPLRFAQARGWINDDFDPEIYIAWLTGVVNRRG